MMAGQHHTTNSRIALADLPDQLETGHAGHRQIHKQQVRFLLPEERKRRIAVTRLADDDHSEGRPVNQRDEAFTHQTLVIDYNSFNHRSPPCLL
ncbi:hypothetical protein D3C75_968650 [compost metagenome]